MIIRQQGFTFIELIISLGLGLSLAAGIGSLFVFTQKNYRLQSSLGIMMEDGSYILEILSKELRQAGFLRNKKSSAGSQTEVFQDDFDTLGSSEVNMPIDFERGEYIRGVSDNVFAFRYQLKGNDLNSSNGNSNSPCTRNIQMDETMWDSSIDVHVVTLLFYVAPDWETGVPTLFCRAKRERIDNLNIPPTTCLEPAEGCSSPSQIPLISNVERFVVKYGVHDNSSTPNDSSDDMYYYTSADDIDDWKKVVSLKVFVVMHSEEDNLARSFMNYKIEDTAYAAMDKRLYQVFSTTVVMRNTLN